MCVSVHARAHSFLLFPTGYSIHDIGVVDIDAVSYQCKTPEKFLETTERENKKNYLNNC